MADLPRRHLPNMGTSMSTSKEGTEASGPPLRSATFTDLDELLRLEEVCFCTDRLTRRSFRRFIAGHAATLVVAAVDSRQLMGYALILLRSNSRTARLYSIAVDPAARGRGFGEQLVQAAEEVARCHHRTSLRLEVRTDNPAAIRLYERLGYQQFGSISHYYGDRQHALCYQKQVLLAFPSTTL